MENHRRGAEVEGVLDRSGLAHGTFLRFGFVVRGRDTGRDGCVHERWRSCLVSLTGPWMDDCSLQWSGDSLPGAIGGDRDLLLGRR